MTASTPINISKKSQDGVIQFLRSAATLMEQNWNIRSRMRDIDLAYQRELDYSTEQARAQQANAAGDPTRLQNIAIPVVLPAVEACVTYQASVFLTGHPLFGVVSNPANQDQALQLETVIEKQSTFGGWVRELMMFLRDGAKYNLAAIEVPWDRKIVPSFENDVTFAGGKQGKPKETFWEGNCVRRLDLYNTFWDTRVPVTKVHEFGEFAGYNELMSRIALKAFIAALPDKMVENITAAFESGSASVGLGTTDGGLEAFCVPQINPKASASATLGAGMNWLSWAEITGANRNSPMNYYDSYLVTTLYARILPIDFGIRVPAASTPQVWKFIIINNSVVIYAERQTNAHNWIPILFGQPLEDGLGLGYQTKSLAENVSPIQSISTALLTSVIAARRRAISDRGLYDPSRVAEAHINSANPSAKIPVKPSAYGKPLSEAYYPIPFRDENSAQILQMLPTFAALSNVITGQNPVRQGQFVKGNKTRKEFSDVMENANGKDQMMSLLYEAQVFTPLKHIIKTNILQYQGAESIYNRQKESVVNIDPVALRNAVLDFKLSDGLIPTSKIINSDVLITAMQTIATSPQINSQYNIGPLFSYLMKTEGGDLRPFEKSPEQVAYEQAMQQWQSLALEAIKAGQQFTVPQPVPQNYGYNPGQQGTTTQVPQPEVRVNNITNNITNQG